MNSSDIALVKGSFARLTPIADLLIPLFFARLFELDPQLRLLMAGNMTERGRQLVNRLGQVVEALEQPEVVNSLLGELAQRDLGPGTKEEHYLTISAAWLWMLEKGLGRDFTTHLHAAWTNVFAYLIHTLVHAQRERVFAA